MTEPKRIPLHDFHAQHGARFVDFGGWNMPVQYTSILEEHKAVRTAAGLFDVSHMGEFFVSGADAAAFLDRLLTNRISTAKAGKAIYSPMCEGNGTVVDDLIVYRIEDEQFLVCVNASNIEKDFEWFCQHVEKWQLAVEVENQSSEYALLALQGPLAEGILADMGMPEISNLKRFNHLLVTYGGSELRVCRTGYTGEDGFEIYVAPDKAEVLAQAIMEAGSSKGLCLCGLGARDSLRLEAGLPLYGHELSNEITPIEAGLDWTVKLDKKEFNGKEALAYQKEQGGANRVVFFRLEGRRIAREGTTVLDGDGANVGRVLSGTLSPMTGSPIGSALISSEAANESLSVDLRGNQLALNVAIPPLHK